MVIRQQVSDVLAYGSITTTITKAKETKKHVDRMITLGKKGTLAARRDALAILLNTQNATREDLAKKLFDKIAPGYKDRKGGYTRVLKLGTRASDRTEEAILQLV
ncbi:unnamed protein product [Didymodactylos carnosus]|uniref:Large ribosomal subunit protein bL17m n=1 Tax=Didymodactylos carnosus TaxID=1234261 RepID=A0A8S2CWH7_9BILA|nr:unnamed protein product [Didymodactylos carnosus]CAF3532615.1 unnamed protein product [Didymodactylos carnosus]